MGCENANNPYGLIAYKLYYFFNRYPYLFLCEVVWFVLL